MKLNLASGPNVFEGWVNIDRDDVEETYLRHLRGLDLSQMHGWPPEQVKLSEAITAGRIQFFCWDLRKGLPMYPDNSVDALYIGQAWEHMHPLREAPALARECLRVLKKGGAVRIVTPDICKIVDAYRRNEMDLFANEQPAFFKSASAEAQLSYLLFGASGDGCTQEHYDGHFHIWSAVDLERLLLDVGFARVCSDGPKGVDFSDCEDKGLSHSFAVEAVKQSWARTTSSRAGRISRTSN